ncbi:D-alanyl-D-alanine carboxypeptidase family protein [Breoghania sp. L-A4]|uniref:D-alanyl-D-alanine carboxypeptidase family protein n=1 Tax=Breoghania sp. L-A4 TaxID=2304600 RepID=UPI0013C365E5|nr:D-alanyl-D-alanine carboxypeptidase family protein [Breoghania sp. L-A4]
MQQPRRLGRVVRIAAASLSLALLWGLPARAEIASWLVFEQESGRVIEQHNAFQKWHPASLTKLMTAYVTFDALRAKRIDLTSPVVMSAAASAEPASKMGFKPGTKMTVDNALKMVLVKSANDVAVALAETVGGSKSGFSKLMNAQAARLGMRDSRFNNPHGLPDDSQIVSAYDMALLIRALWADFPQYRDYYDHAGIRFGKRTLKSANREFLLRVRGANGLKTGFICDSGYNVAVSAKRGGRTVVAVVLGAASGLERAAAARALIEKGFDDRPGLFGGGESLSDLRRPAVAKAPPPSGYCKRASKPDVDDLMARYAGGASALASTEDNMPPGVAIGYAISAKNARLLPQATTSREPAKTPKKSNGKIDWAKVMDSLLGKQIRTYAPVAVELGVPKDARAPRYASIATGELVDEADTAESHPLPVRKPGVVAKAPTVDTPVAYAPKPGAIVVLPPLAADGTRTPLVRPAPLR